MAAAVTERIVAAAIKVGQVVHTGPHHATIIHQVVACGGAKPVIGEQGFMTSLGRFVSRREGRRVALEAGQVRTHGDSLTSEELWVVPDPHWAELRAFAAEVVRVARTRPHDGSQLDEDLEGLLITALTAGVK